MKPSEKFKASTAASEAQDAEVTTGVKMLNEDQAKGDKEDMRPDPENSKLARQGRLDTSTGLESANPKTLKANQFCGSPEYLKGYDQVKWSTPSQRRNPMRRSTPDTRDV
jgi:hypothetical protein